MEFIFKCSTIPERMDAREFVRLVNEMLEAMDQHLSAARPDRDGFLVSSTDGFLFVFAPEPERVTSTSVRHWLATTDAPADRLVLFSPEAVPTPTREEVVRRGGTVVDGRQFVNLVRQLGIESPIVPPSRPSADLGAHFLPTAERLEGIMGRAQSWSESGVPALSLRFYRQAAALKPEYLPARIGVARSLSALGLWAEAETAWEEVLVLQPGDVDSRLGRAATLGALGRTDEEIGAYRLLVEEFPDLGAPRAGLLAALIESERWPEARAEAEVMARAAPSDPHLRFLYGLAVERGGDPTGAGLEFASARALGLTPPQEAAIRESVGRSIRLRRARREAPPTPRPSVPADRRDETASTSGEPHPRRKRKLSSSS